MSIFSDSIVVEKMDIVLIAVTMPDMRNACAAASLANQRLPSSLFRQLQYSGALNTHEPSCRLSRSSQALRERARHWAAATVSNHAARKSIGTQGPFHHPENRFNAGNRTDVSFATAPACPVD
jgi:hypothetical protein